MDGRTVQWIYTAIPMYLYPLLIVIQRKPKGRRYRNIGRNVPYTVHLSNKETHGLFPRKGKSQATLGGECSYQCPIPAPHFMDGWGG